MNRIAGLSRHSRLSLFYRLLLLIVCLAPPRTRFCRFRLRYAVNSKQMVKNISLLRCTPAPSMYAGWYCWSRASPQSLLFVLYLEHTFILFHAWKGEAVPHPFTTVGRTRWILMISVSRSEAVIPEQAWKSSQRYSIIQEIILKQSGSKSALTVLSSKNVDFRHWSRLSGGAYQPSLTQSTFSIILCPW